MIKNKQFHFILIILFFPLLCFSQIANQASIYLYQLNTASAEIGYYLNKRKYTCALDELHKCDSTMVSDMNQLFVADVYLYNKDTTTFKKYFINHIRTLFDYSSIDYLLDSGQNYSFMNSSKAELINMIVKNRESSKALKSMFTITNKIRYLLNIDQFARNNFSDTSLFNKSGSAVLRVDSMNMIQLIPLLQSDSECICQSSELLITLFIHLSRYDYEKFQQILEYIERCYPLSVKGGLSAMITDNRIYNLNNKEQKYYTYLFRRESENIKSIELVDEERKKNGLAPLYYSFVSYGLPIPKYYADKINHECIK